MASIFNQATLSYSGGTISSNITTGELLEVLSATKTAVVDEYTTGSEVTYVINIVNSGTLPYTGLTVTDDLGAYEFGDPAVTLYPLEYVDESVTYFVNGVLQNAPAVTAGPPLAITGINVPAGGVATVIYAARVVGSAPPTVGGNIVNTAVIDGGGIAAISVSDTITAETAPDLTIAKSICPASVVENGRITYTFVVQNTGNTAATATDNIVISDTFDPILSDITVVFNGETLTEGTDYTYNVETGEFATVAGVITVPAATYAQDPTTGVWTVDPGDVSLTVSGTV